MLHLTSPVAVLLYLGISLIIYYSCGYTFLNRIIKTNLYKTYGAIISLPIYLAAGITIFAFVSYIVGTIVVNQFVVDLLIAVILFLFARDMLVSVEQLPTTEIRKVTDRVRKLGLRKIPRIAVIMLPSIVASLVILASLSYVADILTIYCWPPPGDIITHGFLTSLIMYNQRIPLTFYPLADLGVYYPLGFHINAAFLSLLLGIYPGESVLLLGGILIITMISLVFTLTYIMTRSLVLSVSAYALTYLSYSSVSLGGDLDLWLFGYLFNGPYPSLFGSLIILFSVTVIVSYAQTKDRLMLLRFYPLLIITLLLVYPNLVFIQLMLFIFIFLQQGAKSVIHDYFRTRKFALVTGFLILSFIYFSVVKYLHILFSARTNLDSYFYVIPQDYLTSSVFGLSIIMAFALSACLLPFGLTKARGRSSLSTDSIELVDLRPLFLAYALTTAILLLSLNGEFYEFLGYVLPKRLTISVVLISFVMNIYALSRLFSAVIHLEGLQGSTHKRRVNLTKNVTVVLAIFLLFNSNGLLVYSLSSHANFTFANNWGWFSHTYSFSDDFKALEWIHENVKDRELILNDFSWSGLYLLSFSVKNVSMYYLLRETNRTRELQQIWLHPDNETLVHSLINKYNVTYILVTREWGYIDVFSDWVYKGKPFDPTAYVSIFAAYGFLEIVFQSSYTTVFTVRST